MKIYFIFTVGKSPDPIIYSIDELLKRYDDIEYYALVSRESIDTLGVVSNKLGGIGFHQYVIENPEDFDECIKATYEAAAEVLKRWEEEKGMIIIDYTGGTKPMASSLVYVAYQVFPQFVLRYIGGIRRDEHGRVISGSEKTVEISGVNRALLLKARDFYMNFNLHKSYELLYNCAESMKSEYYSVLSNFIYSLIYRDQFDYKMANDILNRFSRRFKIYSDEAIFSKNVAKFFRQVLDTQKNISLIYGVLKILSQFKEKKSVNECSKIVEKITSREEYIDGFELLLIDFYLNILRRLRLNEILRACVLTYRLYELLTQYILIVKYRISPTYIDWSKLDKNVVKCMGLKSLPEHLDLQRSLDLLKCLNDEIINILDLNLLRKVQFERNYSLIEHGFSSVRRKIIEESIENLYKAMKKCIKDIDSRVEKLKFPKITDEVLQPM